MFCPDLYDLEDDGFEGSNDELRISQEVFYGNSAVSCRKKCDVDGVSSFLGEPDKMVEVSPSSHCDMSVITNQDSVKDLCVKDAASAELQMDSRALCSAQGSIVDEMLAHDMKTKRMRYSVNELSNFKPYLDKAVASSIPLKQVISEAHHPAALSAPCQILMCHVVESCSEGVTSSCYLLKQYPESDQDGNLGDITALNGSLSGSDGREVKHVDCSISIASPISQESSATKLLESNSMSVPVIEPGPLQPADRSPKQFNYPECGDVILTGDGVKDARAILRSRVDQLLERAGWSSERQLRTDGRYRYVYHSPEGIYFKGFPKVWDFLGHTLLVSGKDKMTIDDDKQWITVDQFCSDLYETLRYIDSTMNSWEPNYLLAHLWRLLDPFVNVVLVDRKVHALRAGQLVKARKSSAFGWDGKVEVEFKSKSRKGVKKRSLCRHVEQIVCGPSMASDVAETQKTRSIYVSEGDSMLLVKTMTNTENLFQGSAQTNAHCGQSSPHQASCMTSPSCSKPNLKLGKGSSNNYGVCLLDEGAELLGRFVIDAGAKNVDFKSEGLSGVEFSKFCCAEGDELPQANGRDGQIESVHTNGWSMNCVDKDTSSMMIPTSLSEGRSGLKSCMHQNSLQSSCCNDSCLGKLGVHDTDKSRYACIANSNFQSRKQDVRSRKKHNIKKRSKRCQLKDDDLLISAIVKKRSFKTSINDCGLVPKKFKLKSMKKCKKRKGSCRLLLRSLGKGGKHTTDRWTLVGERTIYSWLIINGVILINEAIQYHDPKDDAVVKEGLVTKDGILCNCCSEVFSVSRFKIHAGFNQNRPCLNLFVGSGKPYTLCQLQAWSAEYKVRKSGTGMQHTQKRDEFDKNDDSCGICGDGGELLCCDNCPSTFHQSCLSAEDLPEGSWYCPNCTCRVCGALADVSSSSSVALKCSQCDNKYHQVCLTDNDMGEVSGVPWFCGSACEEIFGGLQSCIGLSNQLADGYSWTLLRCIHEDQKICSAPRFALKAECNSKLAVAVTIMEECFLSMIDPRTGIDMIPQVVYNWGSEFARLDYHGFYTAVLEKDDVLICVASIRVHGAALAEMPLIATCSKYRRQGMCRRLLNSIEKMLISLKVEKLVVAAISDLVDTWTIGFGFVPMEEDEKRSLSNINLMVFPGTVMLKKTLYVNQTADQQNGVEDFAALGNAESCKIGVGFEEDVKNGVTDVITGDDTFHGDANEIKVKLRSSPDTSFGEAEHFHAPVGCDLGMNETGKSEFLQFSSLGLVEDDNQMSSQLYAVGSEIKHVLENQSDYLQVVKDEDIAKSLECIELPPPSWNNPNCRVEVATADELPEVLEVMDQNDPLLIQSTSDYLGEHTLINKETHLERTDGDSKNTRDACKMSQNMPNEVDTVKEDKEDTEVFETLKVDAVSIINEHVASEMSEAAEKVQTFGADVRENMTESMNIEAVEKDGETDTGIKISTTGDKSEYMINGLVNMEATDETFEAWVQSNSNSDAIVNSVHFEEVKEEVLIQESLQRVNPEVVKVGKVAGGFDTCTASNMYEITSGDSVSLVKGHVDKDAVVEDIELSADPLDEENRLEKHSSKQNGEYDVSVVIEGSRNPL